MGASLTNIARQASGADRTLNAAAHVSGTEAVCADMVSISRSLAHVVSSWRHVYSSAFHTHEQRDGARSPPRRTTRWGPVVL